MRELDDIDPRTALELYIEARTAELSQATIRSHRSRLGHVIEWCDEEGIEFMSELRGRDLHEYRLWRRSKGDPNNVTMKTQMDSLRVWIRWLETIDAVQPDLSEKVLSPSLGKGENQRDVMIDGEVGDAILEYLDRYEYASVDHVTWILLWRCIMRRGGVRAVDTDDVETTGDDPHIRVKHRPDTGTPLKNQGEGERFIGLREDTAAVIEDYIDKRRIDVVDQYGRSGLITSRQGRQHVQTIQATSYALTRPCKGPGGECPHDRDVSECDAAQDRQKSYECPSSVSPHAVRRGAITHWLSSDVPETIVSDRANTNAMDHYDRRTERQKMQQRREFLYKV